MPPAGRFSSLAILLLALLLPACDKSSPPTESATPPAQDLVTTAEESGIRAPFDEAQVFFEFNTTDDDLGLQLFLDAEGWRRLVVADPNGSQIVRLLAEGSLSDLGITELRFESAEPSPAEVLGRFPEGEYRFRGQTIGGTTLASTATLSHDFLPPPTFSPRNGQLVDKRNTVVTWNAQGAEMVEVILEQEDLGHILDVTVPGSTSRLTVPPQFLRRGTEYKIEILLIAENGNRTIAESTFETEP